MKKKRFKQIRDTIYNNTRADRQDKDNDNKIEDENKSDLIKRMVKGYNKNRNKIVNKPEQPELSQSEKRKRKLADLNSRSSSWKGLESFSDFTGENQ